VDSFGFPRFKDAGEAIFRVQPGSSKKCCDETSRGWGHLSSSNSLAQCQDYCKAEDECSGLLQYLELPSVPDHICQFCLSEVECRSEDLQHDWAKQAGGKYHHYHVTRRDSGAPAAHEQHKKAFSASEDEDGARADTEDSGTQAHLHSHDKCWISAAIIKYVEGRIRAAPVGRSPFPHVYIRGVFPSDFYNLCMMHHLPPVEATSQLYSRSSHTAPARWSHKISELRTQIPAGVNSTLEDGRQLQDISNFWKEWAKAFTSKAFARIWLDKFRMTTSKRKSDYRTKEDRFFYSAELNRDLSGFSVGPHTDGTAKWVTTLFYLPKDDSLLHKGGTLVGKFNNGLSQPGASRWMSFNNYEVARKAQFAPNSLMAFAPCHTSWHAVSPINAGVARDSIQAFVSSKDKIPKEKCG